jgi:hypothetical protein
MLLLHIQLLHVPVAQSKLYMKDHEGRSKPTSVSVIQLTLNASLHAIIQAHKAAICQEHWACITQKGSKKAIHTAYLSSCLRPTPRDISTGIAKACPFTRDHITTFRVSTNIKSIGANGTFRRRGGICRVDAKG